MIDYFEYAKTLARSQADAMRKDAVICEVCKIPMTDEEVREMRQVHLSHAVCEDCFKDWIS